MLKFHPNRMKAEPVLKMKTQHQSKCAQFIKKTNQYLSIPILSECE